MNINDSKFNCQQLNQQDLVNYLDSLGFTPLKIRNADYWYRSPLRDERTASFKVNRKINVWFDYGTGKGGKLVDFGIQYFKCSVKELLDKFSSRPSLPLIAAQRPAKQTISEPPAIRIVSNTDLHSPALIRYIKHRRIAENVAQVYCREIMFAINNKNYTAIGFRNNAGGFELRNQWFKGSTSPKAITSFTNESKHLSVFEGFFDFLSHQTIHQRQPAAATDFLILNSLSFFDKSLHQMENYSHIHLYLDNDKAGLQCTEKALATEKKFTDESKLYTGYKDLNEWMQQIGKAQKKGLHL